MKTQNQKPTRMDQIKSLKAAAERASETASQYEAKGLVKVAKQYRDHAEGLRADALRLEVELYEVYGIIC